jgi:hypothetical protein
MAMAVAIVMSALLAICNPAHAAGEAKSLSLEGQEIAWTDSPYAKAGAAVSSAAAVKVPGAKDQMIINIYSSDAKGNVDNASQPKVILVSGTDTFKLNQTIDNVPLKPGTYLMNVMANGSTGRVVFTVK